MWDLQCEINRLLKIIKLEQKLKIEELTRYRNIQKFNKVTF